MDDSADEEVRCRGKIIEEESSSQKLDTYRKNNSIVTSTMMKGKTKEEEILRVLGAPVVDLWELRRLALTQGGLLNGES